jgi:DNA-binding response OmpR family regulator
MRYKILVVDDEEDNRDFLKSLLESQDYSVLLAEGAAEAAMTAGESKPDLILCDVSMPGADGMSLCRQLKSKSATAGIPVVLMSGARRGDEDQAEGIEKGADDYLSKPFTPRLLKAKIQAVLRRYAAPKDLHATLKSRGLKLDTQSRIVTAGGKAVSLTRKEFDLLTTFLSHPGRVLSARQLLETVWGYDPADYNDPHTVEVHISSLRRKLGAKIGAEIVTVPGVGYRFGS